MQASAESSASAAMPSPSHGARHHRRHRKSSIAFLKLPHEDGKLPDPPSPSNENENGGSHSDSLLADLVLTPLNTISFFVSLFMIDRHQRQWRLSQHSAPAESFWFRLTHWSWLGPEPYQQPQDATWKHNDNAAAQNAPENAYQGWYTRKKKRAMAKMEIGGAFEMRRRVVFAILAWAVLGLFVITYAARRMYAWMSRM